MQRLLKSPKCCIRLSLNIAKSVRYNYVKNPNARRDLAPKKIRLNTFFWVRSCLDEHSDSVHICTETFFIFQEILRAKSDTGLNTCWVNLAVNWNAVHICTETDSIIWGIPRAESDSAASLQCDCRSIV
jgi:hypothetical protein